MSIKNSFSPLSAIAINLDGIWIKFRLKARRIHIVRTPKQYIWFWSVAKTDESIGMNIYTSDSLSSLVLHPLIALLLTCFFWGLFFSRYFSLLDHPKKKRDWIPTGFPQLSSTISLFFSFPVIRFNLFFYFFFFLQVR
jgi:hypothetical protein